MSQYLTFLEQLFHDGRLALAEINEPTPDEIRNGQQFAAEFEKDYRLELAGDAPAFSPGPFNWAAVNLYRAAQFILFRDIPEEIVQSALGHSIDLPKEHSVIYSVDLVFRFLPDLLRFARRESESDPVVARIEQWLADWPLSNSGIPSETFSDHDSLCRLYVDRLIIKAEGKPDLSTISDLRVLGRIQSDFGTLLSGSNRP